MLQLIAQEKAIDRNLERPRPFPTGIWWLRKGLEPQVSDLLKITKYPP